MERKLLKFDKMKVIYRWIGQNFMQAAESVSLSLLLSLPPSLPPSLFFHFLKVIPQVSSEVKNLCIYLIDCLRITKRSHDS